jgi:hypothetical protein
MTDDERPRNLGAQAWAGWRVAPEVAAIQYGGTDLVKVGSVALPRTFELRVFEPNPKVAGDYLFDAVLGYAVTEGDGAVLRTVWSNTHDVPTALDELRRERPLAEWLRIAIGTLVADAAEDAGSDVPAAIRAATTVPVTRRRDRVTDALLRAVADVYREAWTNGEPPTKAVATHFYKSHSTAARWVHLAREAGHLGPADGSRGGEVNG